VSDSIDESSSEPTPADPAAPKTGSSTAAPSSWLSDDIEAAPTETELPEPPPADTRPPEDSPTPAPWMGLRPTGTSSDDLAPPEKAAATPGDQPPGAGSGLAYPSVDPYRLERPRQDQESGLDPYRPIADHRVRPLDSPPEPSHAPTNKPLASFYPAPTARPEPPRRAARWPLALLALASGLLGALLVLGGLYVGGVFDEEPPPVTTTASPTAVPPETVVVREVISPENSEGVATAVGLKVVPSIVTVEVGAGSATDGFQGFGSGSGVVFSEDGLILTNHHVIAGSTTTRVIFQDGRIYEATVIGSDELTDLAVLQVDATGLTPIEIGTTLGLQIGDRAIAVGNPLGLEGGASLTVGVVSAFDREVDTGDATPLFGMIQTDAPITNGSSGGALVDGRGRLIGITTAIGVSEAGAEGIGFATPVEIVNRIADQIVTNGQVAHAFLGVQLRPNFEIQDDGAAIPSGAIVSGFGEGSSAAAAAGLQIDDVITSWNGQQVRTLNDLINGIRSSMVGETIILVIDRGGEEFTFDVILGERPEGV